MAGHSKWANIKFRKGRQDVARGKLFTKLIRALTVAAREGGSDPDTNPGLRLAIDKALAGNMSRDTIDRAIKRGSGADESVSLENVRYEGYGAQGVAVMVDCLTDNRNRTVAEVRHVFTKYGGNLGTSGSVAYMFIQQGMITFAPGSDEDLIMEIALENDANDVIVNDDGSIDVVTDAANFNRVKESFVKANLDAANAEVTMNAANTVELGVDDALKVVRMLTALEDLDDVQEVYSNADIPDEAYEQLA